MKRLSFRFPRGSDRNRIWHLCKTINTFLDKFGNFFIKTSKKKLFASVDVPAQERKSTPPDIFLILHDIAITGNLQNLDMIGMRQNKKTIPLILKTDMVNPTPNILNCEQYLK